MSVEINLKSNFINVFPATRRSDSYQRKSRSITENSIATLVRNMNEKDSYVLTDSYSNESLFEFYIHGYYFSLGENSNLINSFINSNSIYAIIILDQNKELTGQDITNNSISTYYGIKFIDSDPSNITVETGSTLYSLKILEKSGTSWIIPEQSKIRFTAKSVYIDTTDSIIDGGIIS